MKRLNLLAGCLVVLCVLLSSCATASFSKYKGVGRVASFTYGFDVSVEAFKEAKVELVTLTNYNAVLDAALKTDYIDEQDIPVLQAWRKDPAHWTGK